MKKMEIYELQSNSRYNGTDKRLVGNIENKKAELDSRSKELSDYAEEYDSLGKQYTEIEKKIQTLERQMINSPSDYQNSEFTGKFTLETKMNEDEIAGTGSQEEGIEDSVLMEDVLEEESAGLQIFETGAEESNDNIT